MYEKLKAVGGKGRSWWANLSRLKKILLVGGVLLLLYIIFHHKDPLLGAPVETVTRGELTRTVQASGTVVSATDLVLSFQTGDFVRSIRTYVGQKVAEGQFLASLQSYQENAQVTKAKGAVLAAQAAYNKVLEGNTNEEIRLAQVTLDTTIVTEDNLVENARRKLLSDDLEAVPFGDDARSNIPIISGLYTGVEGKYRIEPVLFSGKYLEVNGLERTSASISSLSPKPLGTKGLNIQFLDDDDFSNGVGWDVFIPNTKGPNYVTNLNAYNAALATRDAEVAKAQAALDLKKATARPSDVDAALANLITANGQLEEANAQLEKKIIRAPAAGTITKIDINPGEMIEALAPAIVLQDVGNLYLEALINESDISTLALEQPVSVTYDAFGPDKKYTATLSSIDLSSTVEDGIVNYKVKALIEGETAIRPGMTANLVIQTAKLPSVLMIPARMITTTDEKHTVSVLIDERKGKTETREIEMGLRGDGDRVEVTSGLSEGEKVVLLPQK